MKFDIARSTLIHSGSRAVDKLKHKQNMVITGVGYVHFFCSLKEQTETKFNGIQEILKVSLAFLQNALLIYSCVT